MSDEACEAPAPERRALILRTCTAAMAAYGGFAWPESGYVEAPDWGPTPECGQGLHGLLWGEGDGNLVSWEPDARWVVAEVDSNEVVDLRGKVKVPRAWVVHVGDQLSATAYVRDHGGRGRAVVGGTATAGHSGTATAGDYGTATAGHSGTATAGVGGTATAGNGGTATAGDYGTAMAGYRGTATAGNYGTATAGYRGTATAGDGGIATAGNYGIATAGNYGTAMAGYRGTAMAGYRGTATAGVGGTATAGDSGTVIVAWWDHDLCRRRWCIGEVGLGGIEAGVPYKVKNGKLVRAEVTGE